MIVADVDARGERAKASSAIQDILHSHQDFKGVVGNNDDSALGASKAVSAVGVGGKVAAVVYDATPEAGGDQGGHDVRRCDPASGPDGAQTIDATKFVACPLPYYECSRSASCSLRRASAVSFTRSAAIKFAAVVVGGTSLSGGRGTFLGALLIGVLNNVMNLLNLEPYTQDIVLGVVILAAVIVDEVRKRFLTKA